MDIWWPLSLGGTIVAPSPEQLRDPAATRALIRRHAVVFLMIVPTHFQVRPLQRRTAENYRSGGDSFVSARLPAEQDERSWASCLMSCVTALPCFHQVLMDTCRDAAELGSLKCLALGGEALNPATLARAQQMVPRCAIRNCYGPTEASVRVSATHKQAAFCSLTCNQSASLLRRLLNACLL